MQIEIVVGAFEVVRDGEAIRYPESFLNGIFALEKHPTDNKKDKLKWCFAMPGESRPTNFLAASGSNHKLIELERFNEAEAIKAIRGSSGRVSQHGRGWIESVFLRTPSINALAALKDLKRLTSVTLGVADEDVGKHLSGHPTLETLRFDCEVPAEVISKLAATLPRLKTLEISCSKFTATYADAIAKSDSLRTLLLSRNNIDEGKRLLEALPNVDVRVRSVPSRGFGAGRVGGNF